MSGNWVHVHKGKRAKCIWKTKHSFSTVCWATLQVITTERNCKCTKSTYGGRGGRRGGTLKLHLWFSAVFPIIIKVNAGKERLYYPALEGQTWSAIWINREHLLVSKILQLLQIVVREWQCTQIYVYYKIYFGVNVQAETKPEERTTPYKFFEGSGISLFTNDIRQQLGHEPCCIWFSTTRLTTQRCKARKEKWLWSDKVFFERTKREIKFKEEKKKQPKTKPTQQRSLRRQISI